MTIKPLTAKALGRLGKCAGLSEYAIKTKISYVGPINIFFHSVCDFIAMKLADNQMREIFQQDKG